MVKKLGKKFFTLKHFSGLFPVFVKEFKFYYIFSIDLSMKFAVEYRDEKTAASRESKKPHDKEERRNQQQQQTSE